MASSAPMPLTASSSASNDLVTHVTGDLFLAPAGSILVQACNTQGSWGGGIAVAFKARFPQAFSVYNTHCTTKDDNRLIGTCLLIRAAGGVSGEQHDIACLFTSRRYGARKDTPAQILEATGRSLLDLKRQNMEGKELHAWRVLAKRAKLNMLTHLQQVQFRQIWRTLGGHSSRR